MTAEPVRVRFRRLSHAAGLPLPAPASVGSAGLDLRAAIDGETTLSPGHRLLVPTGFAVALPPGHEGQVRPRSGLAARHGVTVINAPGTIDGDYRGEILVALVHLGDQPVVLRRGDRIAQLVVAPVAAVTVEEVDRAERDGAGRRRVRLHRALIRNGRPKRRGPDPAAFPQPDSVLWILFLESRRIDSLPKTGRRPDSFAFRELAEPLSWRHRWHCLCALVGRRGRGLSRFRTRSDLTSR